MNLAKRIAAGMATASVIATASLAVRAQAPAAAPPPPTAPPMALTSTAFADGGVIPDRYTQAGDQVSPALTWTNAPAGTVSFVLHFHDLDVARNKTTDDQLHWIVWNIPAAAKGLPEGMKAGADLPDGSHQASASGPVYRGPGAPATGPRHHYTFEVFALDTKLDVPASPDAFETRANVMKALQGHIVGKAVYAGLFRRPGTEPQGPAMVLTSTAFSDGGIIPDKYSQAGEGVSPALTWTNTPAGTVSHVVLIHDPDGSSNKTTEDGLHWLVWNIPASTSSLPEGMKAGAELPDGTRQTGYAGAMYKGPGARANGPRHHYTFEVFALDVKLDVPPEGDFSVTRANVMKAMQGHVIGKAVTQGLFRRPQ